MSSAFVVSLFSINPQKSSFKSLYISSQAVSALCLIQLSELSTVLAMACTDADRLQQTVTHTDAADLPVAQDFELVGLDQLADAVEALRHGLRVLGHELFDEQRKDLLGCKQPARRHAKHEGLDAFPEHVVVHADLVEQAQAEHGALGLHELVRPLGQERDQRLEEARQLDEESRVRDLHRLDEGPLDHEVEHADEGVDELFVVERRPEQLDALEQVLRVGRVHLGGDGLAEGHLGGGPQLVDELVADLFGAPALFFVGLVPLVFLADVEDHQPVVGGRGLGLDAEVGLVLGELFVDLILQSSELLCSGASLLSTNF